MKKLLSLPDNLAKQFHKIYGATPEEWFCASDPHGVKVGSGGGTVALIEKWRESGADTSEKKIIVHACGESRRLPAYAPLGKVLTPVPVFRWASGQSIDQTLLSLQMPLYEEIMTQAPDSLRTLIASGDVYIHATGAHDAVPDADVVCYGLWADAQLASHHGVFVLDRNSPQQLKRMEQKPSMSRLSEIASTHYFLMDIGIWLLSDKAMQLLEKKSRDAEGNIRYYDLYSQFGCALGSEPLAPDPDLAGLTVAIVPMTGAEFYHFGTSAELVSSTLALQGKVADQRLILNSKIKPHPALFTQNCRMGLRLNASNSQVWVENSHVPATWKLSRRNIVTGVPENSMSLSLPEGVCLDIVPVGEHQWALRPYGFTDMMRGALSDPATTWMERSVPDWFSERGLEIPEDTTDIQYAPIFPLVSNVEDMEQLLRWMIAEPSLAKGRELWLASEKISASGITDRANLDRLTEQRRNFLRENIAQLASNHANSVFYQLNLDSLAKTIKSLGGEIPPYVGNDAPLMERARSHMFRYAAGAGDNESDAAYGLLRESVLSSLDNSKVVPVLNAYSDQIIWARSPLRIDLAGGWTDTPPFSLTNGANVVNMAVELNSQPPLQTYVKPCKEPHIVLNSIDMSASETVTDYDSLTDFNRVGSPFSIPKAALTLAGFAPGFSAQNYKTLRSQLESFGCGIEITLLSAVPAGSGLGTSSILASTVLAALNEFCGLGWDKNEICRRTLSLEQLLTTGGGWQDQFGGVLPGIKLLQTVPGLEQSPLSRWLPDQLFTSAEYAPCHLLYYTGITRTAKHILSEIVRGMFLNRADELRLLESMKLHALDMADAIQRGEFHRFGKLVARTWEQNQRLDSGTNPPAVQEIISKIEKYCLGLKLPGAGGGGFIYMVARDPDAAARIRETLTACPPNPRARFVKMSISRTGLQVSRS